jgi:hypothetical protein
MALVDKVTLDAEERLNLRNFASRYGRVALLHVTETMLRKSIADAHWAIRDLLNQSNFHSYDQQPLGPDHKVLRNCTILIGAAEHRTKASLYRPLTKSGDPRLWIYGLQEHVKPGNTLAISVLRGELYIANLSGPTVLKEAIASTSKAAHWASREAITLLEQLKQLALGGPIPQIGSHDTSVGRSIEHALGISQNSSQIPDFMGVVEIKAVRGNRPSSRTARKQLFAQVPDWSISECKSIKSFLQLYGYRRKGILRLTCTVETNRPNSQGLKLQLLASGGTLIEIHEPTQHAALTWQMSVLQKRLEAKHHETFWVKLDEVTLKGRPAFQLRAVEHTGPPASQLLSTLLQSNQITLDHLIKQTERGTTERGPSFKITPAGHEILFPIRTNYALSE